MTAVHLVAGPLPPFRPAGGDPGAGAELVFHGRVRDQEGGRPIVALEYEHYPGMAERELERLAAETVARFGLQGLTCLHRVGRVPVGEAALRVVIRAVHRREASAGLRYFLDELKRRVPIWKWGVTAAGKRFPAPGPGTAPERRPR